MDAAITNTSPITQTPSGVPPEPPEARHQAGAENPEATGGDQKAGDAEGKVACGLSATYSPDDNKLRLYSMSRLDRETYERVKAAGFSWAPKQGFFVAPMWTPGRADLLLALCGEIGDEDTTLVERAEDRADRFEDYSGKRAREADSARRAVDAIADNIPLGQPILVGHHSERHARRDAQRIQDGMRRSIKLWDTAQYWQQRAAGALRNAKYKELPAVRHRRIKGIEADKRKQERRVSEARQLLQAWQADPLTLERAKELAGASYHSQCFPLAEFPRELPASQYEGSMDIWSALDRSVINAEQASKICRRNCSAIIESAERWIEHYDHRLAYERAMLQEQGGIAADRFDFQVGGRVLVRGEWVTILRLNRVGGCISSVSTNRSFVPVVSIEDIKDYQAPTAEVSAKIKEATKLPPLCNYPGPDALELTQAEWAKVYKDHKGTGLVKAVEGTSAHRRRRVDNFIARDRGHEAAKASQWGRTWVYIKDAKRVDPPKAPDATKAPTASAIPAPERVQPRPTYQAPASTEFNAMREQLRQGIKVVAAPQLFPTPSALARRMVELAKPQLGERVLEPSSGTLRLLEALPFVAPFGEQRQTGLDVVAVEVQHELAQLARASGLASAVHCRDFLEITSEELGQPFDLVLMNPPFGNAADVKHIQHAVRFLKAGGRLVAICAAGPRQHEHLQPLVAQHGGSWEPLPADTFAEAGTTVRTVLLAFSVPVRDFAPAEVAPGASTAE